MFPAASSQQRLSSAESGNKPSKKVPLKQGRSLVDWIRLTKSGKDLKGTGPRLLRIPLEELVKHNKPDDLWIALRGMVYNVTFYVEYHPGGAAELMRGAGKDATLLFDEVHRWVNYESMLKECLIGKLVDTHSSASRVSGTGMLAPPPPTAKGLNPLGMNTLKIDTLQVQNSLNVPQIKVQDLTGGTTQPQGSIASLKISHDWYQNGSSIVFVVYTKSVELKTDQIVCDILDPKSVFVDIRLAEDFYTFHVSLCENILYGMDVRITKSGNAQITLQKRDPKLHWASLGTVQCSRSEFTKRNVFQLRFCDCVIQSKERITHDTSLYHIELPSSRRLQIPIGLHVYVKCQLQDIEIRRPYTPVVASFIDEDAEKVYNSATEFYLAIKHYENGALTGVLQTLSPGQKIAVSTYDGDFDIASISDHTTFIMLAAGTGITPMIRVLYYLMHKNSNQIVYLLFFNKGKEDIIWEQDFATFSQKFQGRFFIEHILSRADAAWDGKRGRISKPMLEEYLAQNVPSIEKGKLFFLVCGPNEFTKLGISIISELGFQNMHAFT